MIKSLSALYFCALAATVVAGPLGESEAAELARLRDENAALRQRVAQLELEVATMTPRPPTTQKVSVSKVKAATTRPTVNLVRDHGRKVQEYIATHELAEPVIQAMKAYRPCPGMPVEALNQFAYVIHEVSENERFLAVTVQASPSSDTATTWSIVVDVPRSVVTSCRRREDLEGIPTIGRVGWP